MADLSQRALTHFFSLKKSPKNGGGKNTPPLFLGTLGVKNSCFGGVFLSFLRLKCFHGNIWVGFKEKNSSIFPFQFVTIHHFIYSFGV
jgi:hypothetical protein